jgi:hypothetical protein
VSRFHRPAHLFQQKLASLSRVERARLAKAPALKSDDELIAEAVAAGRMRRRIAVGVSGLSALGPKRVMQSKPQVV